MQVPWVVGRCVGRRLSWLVMVISSSKVAAIWS